MTAALTCAHVRCVVRTRFSIVSGVRKGMIIAKEPGRASGAGSVAHVMELGKPNYACRDDYIIGQ